MVPAGPPSGRRPSAALIRPLVVTPGDPRGIGPEVACTAIAARLARGEPADVVLVGDGAAIREQAAGHDLALHVLDGVADWQRGVGLVCPPDGEPVEVAAIRLAVEACQVGDAAAMVTGPIHKGRLAAHGFGFPGHTDFLGHLCGVEQPVMAFVGGSLMVALVTVHLPLREVADAVTRPAVEHVLRVAHAALRTQLRLDRPRLVVCGLNPHAGDDGLLGTEERDVIAPAVEAVRKEGIDAVGPISAEAAFRKTRPGDMVVAMYHDQGLVPLKRVDFGRSVNWTLGLPIVRTSVDHGTADDIAGHGVADASSMEAAIAWALRLSGGPTPR